MVLVHSAKISSNSWGTSGWSNTWDAPWSMVLQNNPQHIFVAAAGNQDQWINQNNKKSNSKVGILLNFRLKF